MSKSGQSNRQQSTRTAHTKQKPDARTTKAAGPGRSSGGAKGAPAQGGRSTPAKSAKSNPVQRRNRQTRKPQRGLVRRILWIAAWVGALGAFWCAYLLWTINGYSPPKQLEKADAAIVLGAALWNDQPSPGLKERLDHAYELYEKGIVTQFILSGGLDRNGATITEAEGMRNYLVQQKGMPEKALVLENNSTSTYENLLFSKQLLKANGWKKVIIVTHDYHATRAGEIARFIGYEDAVTAGFKSKVLSAARNQFREVLAMTKWKLDALLLLTGVRSTEGL